MINGNGFTLQHSDPRHQRIYRLLYRDHQLAMAAPLGPSDIGSGYELLVPSGGLNGDAVVDGLVFRGGVTLLYGPPGSGKSAVAASIAKAVLDGGVIAGRRAKKGRVLYVCPEVDPGARRAVASAIYSGADEAAVECYRSGALAITGDAPPMRPEPTWDHNQWSSLDSWLFHVGERDLVVIDTWADCLRSCGLNESLDGKTAVTALERILAWTGGAVLVIHHPAKKVPRGVQAQERGGSELRACASVVIPVDKVEARADGITTRLRLSADNAKMRYGPKSADLHLRFSVLPSGLGLSLASAGEVEVAPKPAKPAMAKLPKQLVRLLGMIGTGADLKGLLSETRAKRTTLQRSLAKLETAGLVATKKVGSAARYSLTESGLRMAAASAQPASPSKVAMAKVGT